MFFTHWNEQTQRLVCCCFFQLMVLGNLPVHSILNVSCTCRELRSLSNDSTLWQQLVFRDFGKPQVENCLASSVHLAKTYKGVVGSPIESVNNLQLGNYYCNHTVYIFLCQFAGARIKEETKSWKMVCILASTKLASR